MELFGRLGPQAPVSCHPFAIHRLLALNPQAYMVCHGLWNNTPRVVRYNQEHLRLDARLSASRITDNPPSGIWDFEVAAADTEQPVASGSLPLQSRQPFDAVWAMSQHLGMRGMVQSLRAPFIHVPVVNTRSAYAADNYVAHTYTRSDRQVIRRFGAQDRLVLHDPRYTQLDFRPDFVQHNVGVRFVYLRPEPLAS
jgi:hypothetical protein